MKQPAHAQQLSLEPRSELHCHTTCSDGALSPELLFAKARDFNINVLAITDHDTTDAFATVQPLALEAGIDLISGCECTCSEGGKEFHLLAYAFELRNTAFQQYLAHTRDQRRLRCLAILERLAGMGMPLELADVLHFANGQSIVRPHIASALVSKGYVSSSQDAFDQFLANDAPAYVAIADQALEEAITLIHAAGGLAVIAHPARSISTHRIVELLQHGLDGIEVGHTSHNKAQTRYYRGLARQYNVLATCGSDFHGSRFYEDGTFGRYSASSDVLNTLRSTMRKHSAPKTETQAVVSPHTSTV